MERLSFEKSYNIIELEVEEKKLAMSFQCLKLLSLSLHSPKNDFDTFSFNQKLFSENFAGVKQVILRKFVFECSDLSKLCPLREIFRVFEFQL